jgi:PPK2 family polyphosphate:nucleotide phosphotransferase
MWSAPASPYLVPDDGSFRVARGATAPPAGAPNDKDAKKRLGERIKELDDLARCLYAHDQIAVLCIFQAMDAAGKDGVIRAVFSGVEPAGVEVHYFKQPSPHELDHDFLWRTTLRLPPRGHIGVFNRSYYEEVLVVRVHPEILASQKLPWRAAGAKLWDERLTAIRGYERHLAASGTVVLKFFLNVSRDEQRRRFLARLDEPSKNWKFSEGDVRESERWDDYMNAFEAALNATSRPWAPWYAIPADDKPFARLCVAEILADAMKSLNLRYPEPEAAVMARFDELRRMLEGAAPKQRSKQVPKQGRRKKK